MRLWVIGNGFDLHHGLKTMYSDYRAFLCQKYACNSKMCMGFDTNLPREVCKLCCSNNGSCADLRNENCLVRKFNDLPRKKEDTIELWKDLEKSCSIDLVALLKHLDGWAGREPESESLLRETPLSHLLHGILDFCKFFTGGLFFDWLQEIEKSLEDKNIMKCSATNTLGISPNDLFLTFNYTSTLQKLYHINGDKEQGRIFYIHGRFDETKESIESQSPESRTLKKSSVVHSNIVFGSSELTGEAIDKAIDAFEKSQENCSPANKMELRECLQKLLKYLRKNTSTAQKRMKDFIKGHSHELHSSLKEVVVAGHSLGEFDQPYFDILSNTFRGTRWRFLVYYETDSKKAREFIEKHKLDATYGSWEMANIS